MVSKQLVVHHSSQRDNKKKIDISKSLDFSRLFLMSGYKKAFFVIEDIS